MADMSPTMLQKLAAMLGGGQAGSNIATAQNPAYTNYVRETKAMGGQPLPMQAWQAQQMTPQPVAPQAAPTPPQGPAQPFRF